MNEELPHDWHCYTLEDWTEQLAAKGFRDAEIQFSGFWSQGDGASFTATVEREPPQAIRDKITDYETSGPIAHRLRGETTSWRHPSYELCIRIKRHSDRYVHEYMMYCDVTLQCYDMPEDIEAELVKWADQLETDLKEEARGLAREIYRALEAEYDYQTKELAAAA